MDRFFARNQGDTAMYWKDEYATGIKTVDAQHKRLFQMVEDLHQALQSGLRPMAVETLLTALDEYKTRHFLLEEKYMMESDYPGIEEQQLAHSLFSQQIAGFFEEFNTKGLTPALIIELKRELHFWLENHVTGLDRVFGEYYRHYHSS